MSKNSAADFMTDLFYYAYLILFFFLIFFIKAYLVGIHLNCLDKSTKAHGWYSFELPQLVQAIQMSTNNILYAFIKKQIKIHGCNLKTTNCLTALIGVYVVIRSNTM